MERVYLKFKNFMILILILVAVVSTILLAGQLLLQNNINKVVEETSLILSRQQGYNEKIKQLNQQINFVGSIQNQHVKWSGLLIEIGKVSPEDISINYLNIQDYVDPDEKKKSKKKKSSSKEEKYTFPKAVDKIITIHGYSPTRDSFLELKNNLEKSPYLTEIDSPFSNLLKEKNIEFNLSAKINLEQLQP